ncbi:MAG: hypothetical protein AAB361_00715 [Patescibacteria group bacterium]
MSLNSEHLNGEEQEPGEPLKEIRVGGGDPIKILKVVEGVERMVGGIGETVNVELTPEEIQNLIQDLSNLPFHVGDSKGAKVFDYRGEVPESERPVHEAEVTIEPHSLRRPKGKEEYSVTFRFKNPDIWDSGFSPHSAKNLKISQPMWSSAHGMDWPEEEKERIQVRVGFSPEKNIKIGNKKITVINLLAER